MKKQYNIGLYGCDKMVRSEKEIKKELSPEKIQLRDYYQGYNNALRWTLEGPARYTISELEEKGLILPLHNLQKSVEYSKRLFKFIKEPHYSVAELEKIWKHIAKYYPNPADAPLNGSSFFNFLKDKKRVEAILNG